MVTQVLGFGIVREIFKGPGAWVELTPLCTTEDLRELLEKQFPALKNLASYMIAVNQHYAYPQDILNPGDEIAIIPPVCGG
ncbi:MAG: MoaD/ThiS family protein [Chitinophagaceae bacterium]